MKKNTCKIITLLGVLSTVMSITGCSSTKPLEVTTTVEEIEPFYPPLPPAISPISVSTKVLTPKVTEELNNKVLGECTGRNVETISGNPYVYIGFNSQDWISLGQYNESLIYYIRHLREILKFLGHPSLEDMPDMPDIQVDEP